MNRWKATKQKEKRVKWEEVVEKVQETQKMTLQIVTKLYFSKKKQQN